MSSDDVVWEPVAGRPDQEEERGNGMQSIEPTQEHERREYSPPELVVHGDLRVLTAGGGGTTHRDGGPTAAKSRTTGTA